MISSAVFSDCRIYRYSLWRRWSEGPFALFICLNPSTADETNDDPTVRRCINYSKDWGYGAFCMANIFAYRETSPKKMMLAKEPIGPDNDNTLKDLAKKAGIIIAGWGTHGKHLNRGAEVIKLIPNLQCLHFNKDKSPGHPLYLKADLKPFSINRDEVL
jgi:hypothetical protein